jgi:hypothetical protein
MISLQKTTTKKGKALYHLPKKVTYQSNDIHVIIWYRVTSPSPFLPRTFPRKHFSVRHFPVQYVFSCDISPSNTLQYNLYMYKIIGLFLFTNFLTTLFNFFPIFFHRVVPNTFLSITTSLYFQNFDFKGLKSAKINFYM